MKSRINSPSALLLLPPPSSFTFGGVKEAFEASVSDAFLQLSKALEGSNRIATLDIALQIPGLLSASNRPRIKSFVQMERYVAYVYTLILAVGTTRDIKLDLPGGIDARLIFVDHPLPDDEIQTGSKIGPILDIQSLATSGRQWDHIFFPSNQPGRDLVDSFLSSTTGSSKNHTASILQTVSAGDWSAPQSLPIPEDQPSLQPHYSVAVGGTFDHLHLGHKHLLTALALALEPLDHTNQDRERVLTIGVTGADLLVNKKFSEYLESWDERFQRTAAFLAGIMDFSGNKSPQMERTRTADGKGQVVVIQYQSNLIYKFVEFFDTCGPTATDENISALVVSQETSAGGAFVNEERAKKGWSRLSIFEVGVLLSSEAKESAINFENKIGSTEIRRQCMESDRAKI
ncbi:Cytidylyltransferase [Penicillium verhagenii]|nr:Cytidylyltransferase [Penicillium verhagenii]